MKEEQRKDLKSHILNALRSKSSISTFLHLKSVEAPATLEMTQSTQTRLQFGCRPDSCNTQCDFQCAVGNGVKNKHKSSSLFRQIFISVCLCVCQGDVEMN